MECCSGTLRAINIQFARDAYIFVCSWLLMRYPMQKSTRAKLVRLYFELCLVPGVEPRVIRTWADMLSRLLANKSGSKRKLETTDLQLPWKPLWKALKKELWVKKRVQDTSYASVLHSRNLNLHLISRNVVNILLYVAEQCKRYFPKDEIPSMLDEFLPLLTQDVCFFSPYIFSRSLTNYLVRPDGSAYSDIILTTYKSSPLHACPFQNMGSLQLGCA